jgi:hypothetical protein
MQNALKISICGDVCSECPRYKATQADNHAALIKIAELWYRLGFRDKILGPEDLKCTGCSKDKSCTHGLTNCGYLENKNNCGECDIFPCNQINLVFQKTEQANKTCKDKCPEAEYKVLQRAFLMKKEILTEINKNYKIKN